MRSILLFTTILAAATPAAADAALLTEFRSTGSEAPPGQWNFLEMHFWVGGPTIFEAGHGLVVYERPRMTVGEIHATPEDLAAMRPFFNDGRNRFGRLINGRSDSYRIDDLLANGEVWPETTRDIASVFVTSHTPRLGSGLSGYAITDITQEAVGMPLQQVRHIVRIYGEFATVLEPARGDYNRDGTVDTADYVVWRNGLGGNYTQAQYDEWRANFGRTAGSGSFADSAVPEPSACVLMIVAAACACVRRSRNSGKAKR